MVVVNGDSGISGREDEGKSGGVSGGDDNCSGTVVGCGSSKKEQRPHQSASQREGRLWEGEAWLYFIFSV